MRKEITFKIVKLISLILALFNLLMYFSMRCCWSGISKTLQYEKDYNQFILDFPLIVFFILLALAITTILLFKFMKKDSNLWSIIMIIVNFIFTIAVGVIIALGAIDYMYFIMPEFIKVSMITALIFFVIFMIFVYPKTHLVNNHIFKYSIFSALLLIAVLYVINFSINAITYKPVVYAVDNQYQIVFGTSSDALGWVEINGEKYTDTYAGSEKSFTKVHKISVPMYILENATEYTIYTQRFHYRGPFGAIKDAVISETYTYRGIDFSDGIDYYAISDVHMELDASVAATNYNDKKDFLVLAGDIISLVETEDDAFYTNKVAHEMTKGAIPVVYARGNHEVKGEYSEVFYKYVGSKNENFYYNFYFKDEYDSVYGIVLDLGEDHDDDWWEYYETANYDDYREAQLAFLSQELEKDPNDKKCYQNYNYKMMVCHIPVNYINSRGNHWSIKQKLTVLLNKFNLDISLSGHQHDLFIFEPDVVDHMLNMSYNKNYSSKNHKGMVTDHNFPIFLVSKRGLTQTDSNKLTQKSQIGLNVHVNKTHQIIKYNNSKGELLNLVNPFVDRDYGNEIIIDLLSKKFKQ